MDKQPEFPDSKEKNFPAAPFRPEQLFAPQGTSAPGPRFGFEGGFKALKPFGFQAPLPQLKGFPGRGLGPAPQVFRPDLLDLGLAAPPARSELRKEGRFVVPVERQGLFVPDFAPPVPEKESTSKKAKVSPKAQTQGKDIQIEHLEAFSEGSCEDLEQDAALESQQQSAEEAAERAAGPCIKIISPHLKQYFRKHARKLERQHIKNAEFDLVGANNGAVRIKARLERQKPGQSKLSFSRRIKKAEAPHKREAQRNFWTINQHINIQNINPPAYFPAEQTKTAFPIQNPAKDYLRFKQIFHPSQSSSENHSVERLEPGDVQSNWDLIRQMNLEDKLFLDVASNNIYLKIDNKHDQRFKHFESIARYSTGLEDIKQQLVPVAESLLPNHLLKVKKAHPAALYEPAPGAKESLTDKLRRTQSQKARTARRKEGRAPGVVRKRAQQGCRCSKSKCLRLHCICFKQGKYCDTLCGCADCYNSKAYAELVEKVKSATKDINSRAFESKFLELEREGGVQKITKGCTCMKNNCLKNYCECRKNGLSCTTLCKCDQCFNEYLELTPEEVAKMHTKNSRKKKKIIFQTKDKGTMDFEAREIVSSAKKQKPAN